MAMLRVAACCTLLLATVGAFAADAPQMKPGLWEVASHFESDGRRPRPTMTVQHCVSEKTQSGLWDPARAGPRGQTCQPPRNRREGKVYIVETDCKQGETNVKARITTVAQPDRFESDMAFTYDPPRRGRSTGGMKLVGKFLGACPADLKPGAVRMTGMPVPGAVPATAK
jgi:hypothetical protein